MSTQHSASLRQLSVEFSDISRLQGNCGRKARRAVHQLHPTSSFRAPLSFPELTNLQFACAVYQVLNGLADMSDTLYYCSASGTASIADIDLGNRALCVEINCPPPAQEHGVQALLRWASLMSSVLSTLAGAVERGAKPIPDRKLLDTLCLTAWRQDIRLANRICGGTAELSAEQEAEINQELDTIEALVKKVFEGDRQALVFLAEERPYLELQKVLCRVVPATMVHLASLATAQA